MFARKPFLFAFALALAAGCHSSVSLMSPRRGGGTTIFGGGRRPAQPTTTSAVGNDAQSYLNRLDQHLRTQGYAPAGAAIRNNAMPQTNLVAYAVDAQAGRCYAAIGLGDSGTDLNMIVLDPFGRTEAHNVAADTNPWVSFCPRQSGRYIVRLQMSRGAGGYYYLAYAGQAGRDPQLAAFFGSAGGSTAVASNATPAPRTAQLDGDTRNRYQSTDTSLTRESFARVSEPIGLVLDQRQERLFPLNLTSNACYAFATFGGPGTSDTDVFVVDGSGGELVSDVRADRDAIVRFCPPSDGTYQLRTRLYTGNGPVFVAGWAQQRSTGGRDGSGTTTTPVATTTTPVITNQSTAATGIREAYALVDIDMQARGYAVQGEATDGTLETGANREFAIEVERDKCYAIVALGDSGVRNVELTLTDRSGRVLDRETEVSGRAVVRTCASEAGPRTVRLAMAEGSGAFTFALYQFTRGTRGPFGLAGLTWVRLSEVTALLDTENYAPSIDFSIETGRLASGRTTSATLNLASNKCYAIVVVGGDGVSSVGISLERGGSAVAENRTGSSFPDVRICTQQAGRYELRINATAGSGAYAYEVFERATQ